MSELAEKKYGKKVCYWIGILWSDHAPINTQYIFISFLIVQLLTKLLFISKTNHCIVYLWTSGKSQTQFLALSGAKEVPMSVCLSVCPDHKLSKALNSSSLLSQVCLKSVLGLSQLNTSKRQSLNTLGTFQKIFSTKV